VPEGGQPECSHWGPEWQPGVFSAGWLAAVMMGWPRAPTAANSVELRFGTGRVNIFD